MFGEQIILGQKECTLDSKGRIILPKFTHVEPYDKLAILFSENRDYCKIFLNNRLLELMDVMQQKQQRAMNIIYLKEMQRQINEIYSLCSDVNTVDKQRRILLPEQLREELELSNHVYICGGFELSTPCVKVYKNKEDMFRILNR